MKSFRTVTSVAGPLLIVELPAGETPPAYEELVEIKLPDESLRLGKVLEAHSDRAVVQLFESTQGLGTDGVSARFLGRTQDIGVSEEMLGRIFDGAGNPRDGVPPIIPEKKLDISGAALNPFSRDMPSDFIQTGISTIDVLNTLVRGQKLPIFSGAGLPHAELAVQIARQAAIPDADGKITDDAKFAVVFGAMGVTFEEAEFFVDEFRKTGALERSVLFVNTADQPVVERIATPRLALTTAEYLAYEKGMHVLVILTDMTNYCEALREISAARREVPGRRGYPGYLYTDLATLYERAGRVKNRSGSVTQLPILTMPEDDVTHPVPDLTGYITEGQIRLDRNLHKKGILPPVTPMGSLSRLKGGVVGKKTREDHPGIDAQVSAAYARGVEMRELAVILGESSLSETDQKYLRFADKFEKRFIAQKSDENRTLADSLTVGWDLLRILPRSELKRVKAEHIEKYLDEKK